MLLEYSNATHRLLAKYSDELGNYTVLNFLADDLRETCQAYFSTFFALAARANFFIFVFSSPNKL